MAVDDEIESELSYLNEPPSGDATRWDDVVESVDMDVSHPAADVPHPLEASGVTPGGEDAIEIGPTEPPLKSVSMSVRGLPGGRRRTRGLFGQAHEQANTAAAPYHEEYDREQRAVDEDYQLAHQAIADEAMQTQSFHDRERQLYERQQDFYQTQAELQNQSAMAAHAEAEKFKAQHYQQLAGIKALIAQSGDPTGNLTMGEAAGLGFAKFAEGFLAAGPNGGIHIDVSGQIDRWVDRKIREHQTRIENSQQEAMHVYDLARQSSADEHEARQVYRSYVIEAAKTSIMANAARFGSEIARARGQQQIAQLDMQREATIAGITDRRRQMMLGFDQMYIDEAAKKGTLEIQQAHLQLEREKAAKEKAKQAPRPLLFQDSRSKGRMADGNTTGGKYVAMIDPTAPDGIQAKAWEEGSKAQQLNDNLQTSLDKLRDLYNNLESTAGPGWWKDRTSDAWTLFNAERNRAVGAIQKFMTGMQATDKEAQRWLDQVADDKLLSTGANRLPRLIDSLGDWGRGYYQNALNVPGIIAIPDSDEVYQAIGIPKYAAPLTIDPAGKARYEESLHPTPRMPSAIEPYAGHAATRKSDLDADASSFYRTNRGEINVYAGGPAEVVKRYGEKFNTDKMPSWARDLEEIAKAAANPTKWVEGTTNEDPQDVQLEALDALKSIAHGKPLAEDQPVPPKDRQEYAMKLLVGLDKPEELLKQLGE